MNANSIETVTEAAPSQPLYTIGTLRYDRRGVAWLFAWLLWGDFAFTFFESVFVRFMPLYLKDLHASNTLIGIMTGSIAGLVNILFLPNISQWSDRFRSRLGRRIPFLLVVTPLTVLSLIGIGFAPELGGWLHRRFVSGYFPSLSLATFVLGLLCVFVVLYHFFNMVLVSSFNWLLRDVVPQTLMARFLSWFRIVATIGSFFFLWGVFPSMVNYRHEAFLGIGLFYFASFLLMCWKVKEGGYPEPPPRKSGVLFLGSFGSYFRNCLSVPLYRNFFLAYVLVMMAISSASPFLTLYARHDLSLGMDDIGKIFAYSALISAVAYFPIGWFCEKITPFRVALISLGFLVGGSLLAYSFVGSGRSWFLYSLLFTIPSVGWTLGALTISMQLFPSRDFGQFFSGLNVFGCGGLITGNFLIGELMDATGSHYRIVFIWSAVFFGAAIAPMISVYRGWLQHGGRESYVAPLPKHL